MPKPQIVENQSSPLQSDSTRKRKFRAVKRLTVPLMSVAHKPIMMVQVLESMYTADITIGIGKEAEKKPIVALVMDLDTDETGLLICNEIIRSTLEKVDGGYVGRIFSIRSGEVREGKRYRDIDIVLMEEEN